MPISVSFRPPVQLATTKTWNFWELFAPKTVQDKTLPPGCNKKIPIVRYNLGYRPDGVNTCDNNGLPGPPLCKTEAWGVVKDYGTCVTYNYGWWSGKSGGVCLTKSQLERNETCGNLKSFRGDKKQFASNDYYCTDNDPYCK